MSELNFDDENGQEFKFDDDLDSPLLEFNANLDKSFFDSDISQETNFKGFGDFSLPPLPSPPRHQAARGKSW